MKKPHRINARITDKEKELLDELVKITEKDVSSIVRFAIRALWFNVLYDRNEYERLKTLLK